MRPWGLSPFWNSRKKAPPAPRWEWAALCLSKNLRRQAFGEPSEGFPRVESRESNSIGKAVKTVQMDCFDSLKRRMHFLPGMPPGAP